MTESNESLHASAAVASRVDQAVQAALQRFEERLASEPGTERIRPLVMSFLRQPGKRLRPLLLIEAYRLFAADRDQLPDALFDLAAALELFHAFILMHDDVIDASASRRGEATLHTRFAALFPARPRNAEHLAIVLGDMLFGFSIEQFVVHDPGLKRRGEALRYFLQTVESTGLGEVIELTQSELPLKDVGEETIRSVYHLKTTRYTVEGPLVLGAYLAGAGDAVIRALQAIARPIGFAFQVENDLHEINIPAERFAALAHDFRTGIKTFVLHALHQMLPPEEKDWLNAFLRRAPGEPGDIAYFQQLVLRSGLCAEMETLVHAHFCEGRRAVSNPVLDPTQQEGMHRILDRILQLRHHSESVPSSGKVD